MRISVSECIVVLSYLRERADLWDMWHTSSTWHCAVPLPCSYRWVWL